MTNCAKKLKELIEDTVIPDIEDYLDDIFEDIANNKKASKEQEAELNEMQNMRDDFQEILRDIDNNTLDEDECQELYSEIVDMVKDID